MRVRVVVGLILVAGTFATACGESIWQEGEQPTAHKMNRHPWWYDQVKKEFLSGGDWISNFSEEKEGTAEYRIRVREGGEYVLWLRINPVRTRVSLSIDGGGWRELDLSNALEVTNIAADGKIDLRFIGWVNAGRVTLAPGEHTIAFRFHGELQNHGGLDAFVLTNERFSPKGLAKPGSPETQADVVTEVGTWAFQPSDDPVRPGALIDLRDLNEPIAGEKGFIRLSADGMSFVRGDGQPIRFWAIVDYGWRMEPDKMQRHLRWLAKLGVNMVRVHAQLCVEKEGAKLTDVDEKVIDQIQRYVAECKKHGIYVTISPYWSHTQKIPASWGLDTYTGHSGPEGLIFFEERLQNAYKTWVKELYTRPNPYTGIPLAQDPTVAIIQVQNEDSILFWTSQNIREPFAGKLRQLFAKFLVKKYGSLEKAQAAWGGAKHEKDRPEAGEMWMEIIWRMTSQAPKPNAAWAKRLADQLEFMSRLQYDFYADMAKYYRQALGCRQLLNATNWRTADPVLLEDCERWTYTAMDVSAINRYTGVIHIGPNDGWRIDPNHFYLSQSCLLNPDEFPGALKQTVGQPMILTEVAWVHPGLYQTEGPFLAAVYMSLTGVDAFYWFSYGDEFWTTDPVWPWWKVGGLNSLKKWEGSVPTQAGMFPAAALAYRLGYIQTADQPAVYEERSLQGMWERRVPIIAEAGKFDPNRDPGDFAPQSPIKQEVDRLAFFVGPVHVKFDGQEKNSRVVDLSRYIDREKGIVRSMTGEITLDIRNGVCTVNTPKCQGCTGFLKQAGGRFRFGDVMLTSDNDYATIMVVAMDNRPLRDSEKVLVQLGTTARMTGWTERDATFESGGQKLQGRQILDTGRPPWRLADNRVKLTLNNPSLQRAIVLDVDGYPRQEVSLERHGGAVMLDIPRDCLYVILTK
ncbi:hypothetical protein THTE_3333 [Thermogutta terrifontis]|uniref:Glycoside hydrolase family 42 N-terminal domain-containing protein n=1 Tax=Thermogutta terrifontis TaxID=1331910 RepID=A0A286RIY6_9BACT|nr:hypothetical protein [Thermogutta terrifontis]ASV75935.1 hypothetical protein THTE_3333 [Thermogutta terrifontis]